MKNVHILIVFMLVSVLSLGQYHIPDGGTVYTSSGTIDVSGYVPGEVYTMTICSDDPLCSHLFISFDTWSLSSGANFCVYDGETATELIGCNAWGATMAVNASISNVSGCLTIQFTAPTTGTAILGNIGCNFQCQPLQATVVSTTPAATIEDGVHYLDICQGDDVNLQGAGVYTNVTYPQSDGTSTFTWNIDGVEYSGSTLNETFTDGGGYDINLTIVDEQGCASTNDIPYRIRVSQTPSFAGTDPDINVICQGDTINFGCNVTSYEWVDDHVPVMGDTVWLGDGSGVTYYDTIVFDFFDPDQVLEDVYDLLGIHAILEHSFIGDLVIEITCPWNVDEGGPVTVVLEEQHGGGASLGIPVDPDSTPGDPDCCLGIGYHYSWVPNGLEDFAWDLGDAPGPVIDSGAYMPTESLDALIGCQLNGGWILTISDNWAIDDGWLLGWWIEFDPDILPPAWSFENEYPTQMWTTPGTGTGSIWTGGDCMQGTYTDLGSVETTQPFLFTVVDDFGCTYDTTIYVTVRPDTASRCCEMPEVNINTPAGEICGNTIELDAGTLFNPTNEAYWTSSCIGAVFSDPTSPVTSVTVTSPGDCTFTYTEVNSGSESCTATDDVTITFIDQPDVYIGADTTVCGNSIVLNAGSYSASYDFLWEGESGVVFSPPNATLTSITVPAFTGEMYYEILFTVSDSDCQNTDDIRILFLEEPNPYVGEDAEICGDFYQLNVDNVVGDGYWTVTDEYAAPVYDVIFEDPSETYTDASQCPYAIANVALVSTSSILTFTWYETNGICTGTDDVTITFTAGPYAYAGGDSFTCGDSIQLHADITGVETLYGEWTCDLDVDFWDSSGGGIIDPATDPDAIAVLPPTTLEDIFEYDVVADIDFYWNMTNPGADSCTSSDVVTITFYQEPVAYAGVDTFVCGQNFDFLAIPSLDTFNGEWLMVSGPGTPVYSDINDPNSNLIVTHYGEYEFQWTESNPYSSMCNSSHTISVSFIEVPTELWAGNDTVFCETPDGYCGELNAIGGFGTGVWTCTSTFVADNVFSPSTPFCINHPGTETYCWRETIESGFSQPCVVEKCVDITMEPTPDVTLLSADDFVCGPEYVTINGHVIDADTAYWFDGSHAGTEFINETATSATDVNDTVQVNIYGDHQIYLIAENHISIGSYDAVCSDTSEALVLTFYEWPEPTISPTDTTCGFCYYLDGTQSMDTTNVTWSALSPSGIEFSSTGTIVGTSAVDTVCVEISDTTRFFNLTEYYPYGNRCAVTATIAVKFSGIPEARFDFDEPECFGGNWGISARADSLPSYQWTYGEAGEFVIDSAIFNSEGGEYMDTVYWTDGDTMHVVDLMVTNSYGCNSAIYRDTIYEPPINYALPFITHETCSDTNGVVVIYGEGGLAPESHHEVIWLNTEMGTVGPMGEDSLMVSDLAEGVYEVEIVDIHDCRVRENIVIENTGLIDAVIDEAQFVLGEEGYHGTIGDPTATINLISLTDDARFYRWYIRDVNDSLIAGPMSGQITSFEFLADGEYVIQLEVVSREGCEDIVDYMYIKIQGESYVEVPNIFTPNGDGVNDIFHVNATALKDFSGMIVNRWGKTLYEWTDWNDPNSGWDGTINGGSQFASPGVYYYVVKAVGIDNDKPYEIRGALHLIREK